MENDKSQLNDLKKMVLKQTKNEIHVKQMNLLKLRSDSRYLINLGSHAGLREYENSLQGQIEYVGKIKQASALIMTNPILIDDDSLYNHWSAVSRDCDITLAILLGVPIDEQTRLTIDKLRWDEFSSYFGKVVNANIYANQYSQRTLEALKPEINKLDTLISSLDR